MFSVAYPAASFTFGWSPRTRRLMRIVADTNTLVSGFGWGRPLGQVVDTALTGQVILMTSPALLGELARVRAYPELAAIFEDPAALVAAVAQAADTVGYESPSATAGDSRQSAM